MSYDHQANLPRLARLLAIFTLIAVGNACHPTAPHGSAPLLQRAYLWQREWNPSIRPALVEAHRRLDGVVFLGAEVKIAGGKVSVIRPKIDWAAVKSTGIAPAIILRVDPFTGPFLKNDPVIDSLRDLARGLIQDATRHEISLTEFQFDFDCAQAKLPDSRVWLHDLRSAVAPLHFVITTLPAWLQAREFSRLIAEADGFVLQVHSVPLRRGGSTTLCDAKSVRAWVEKAAAFGRPFSVALPTYRCVAGYRPDGEFLGVAMDSIQPDWPKGTRTLELGADSMSLAQLLHEWQLSHPTVLREILWYRLPVATDVRNWRWPTLAAVMQGRTPVLQLEAVGEGENPIDLKLVNHGESDEPLDCIVTADGVEPLAYDVLAGWVAKAVGGRVGFSPVPGANLRLPPGEARPIGWIRYGTRTPVRFEVTNRSPVP